MICEQLIKLFLIPILLRLKIFIVKFWFLPALVFCAQIPIFVLAIETLELKPQLDGDVDEINFSTDDFNEPVESFTKVFWQKEIKKIGTDYFRLHFTEIIVPDSIQVLLTIEDRMGRSVLEYSSRYLKNNSNFWTDLISGDYALISLYSDKYPTGCKIKIDRIAYHAFTGIPLSQIDENNLKNIINYANVPLIYNSSNPVAKLSFIKNDNFYVCTGFIINGNLLMTNHHCVNENIVCKTTTTIFGYEFKSDGRLPFGEQYRCLEVVDQNKELDYAILKLNGNPSLKWGTLPLSRRALLANEPIFIIQHPGGKPKMVAKENCYVSRPMVDGRGKNTDFSHVCDTAGGSSGSPILDLTGEVVGLHHYGIAQGFLKENRAVRMLSILDSIEE